MPESHTELNPERVVVGDLPRELILGEAALKQRYEIEAAGLGDRAKGLSDILAFHGPRTRHSDTPRNTTFGQLGRSEPRGISPIPGEHEGGQMRGHTCSPGSCSCGETGKVNV